MRPRSQCTGVEIHRAKQALQKQLVYRLKIKRHSDRSIYVERIRVSFAELLLLFLFCFFLTTRLAECPAVTSKPRQAVLRFVFILER